MDFLEGLSLALAPSSFASSSSSRPSESKRSTASKPVAPPQTMPSSFMGTRPTLAQPPPIPPRRNTAAAPPPSIPPARPALNPYAKQQLAARKTLDEKQRKELAKIEKENKKAVEKQIKDNKKALEKQRKEAEKKMKKDAEKQRKTLDKIAHENAKKMKKQEEEAAAAAAKQRSLYANAVFVDTNAKYQAQQAQQAQRMQEAVLPNQPPNLFTAGPLQQYHVAEWNVMQQRWDYRGVSGRDVVEYGVNPQTRKWHRMQPVGPQLDGTPFKR